MSNELEAFKQKMQGDEQARADFVLDVHKALQKQGIDVNNAKLMKELGFVPGDHKDWKNFASSAIITIVM